jgi:Electron transfer DM13
MLMLQGNCGITIQLHLFFKLKTFIMKRSIIQTSLILLAFALITTSCSKDDETLTIDSASPSGTFTPERSGSLTAESGTPTAGTVELGKDEDNVNFLHFGSNFITELATGTVSIYMSTSAVFTASPGTGNPDLKLVGNISKNGEQYHKLSESVPSNFTHVILWCNTAGVPFGNARLN